MLGVCILFVLPALAQHDAGSSATPQNAQQLKSTKASAPQQNDGERKFEQNCSRCHSAPENLSPRISGTVIRHMRVRASLSEQDAKDILHFLRP